MKKTARTILLTFIIFVTTACSKPVATPDPLAIEKSVSETMQAHSQLTDTNKSFGFVLMTETPGPTQTPVPTLIPRNLVDSIVDDIRLNDYCNKDLVPELIKKFHLSFEKADSTENSFQFTELNLSSPQLFLTVEDQQKAIEVIQELLDEIDSTKVPECLVPAKTKLLLGYEEVRKTYERNDSNWFPDLLAAGTIAESGWNDMERIELCLPTGCN